MKAPLYQQLTFSATATPSDLKRQYGQLRYKDFRPDDPFLTFDHVNKTEFDDYDDMDSTLLLLATMSEGFSSSLVAGARILPTTEPYDIEEPSWHYLTNGIQLPKSPNTWVCGRWTSIAENSVHRQICNSLIMLEIHRASIEHGFDSYFGVTTKRGYEWFEKVGITARMGSPEYFTGRENDTIHLVTVDVNERYAEVAHNKHIEAASSLRAVAA